MKILLSVTLLLLGGSQVQCLSVSPNVVNETLQPTTWSLEELQKNVEALQQLIQDPGIPKGFIYVQLPDQPEPAALWREVKWQDISEKYSGLFFRTVGEGAAAFGKTQEEFAPTNRILQYHTSHEAEVQGKDRCYDKTCEVKSNGWSDNIFTGVVMNCHAHDNNYIRFQSESKTGEVRPRNTAVRIWRRV